MGDKTDLIGAIGTWVAVGVTLFTLLGIVGPLLIWRASRTEKHRAIAAIGKKNNGYVSHGIPVWPGIRFYQRIRAPKLHKARKFTETEWRTFDLTRIKSKPDSPSTWVQLGAIFQSYNIKMEHGQTVDISNHKTRLSIHSEYIKMFCVVGRFSRERIRRSSTGAKRYRRQTSHVDDLETEIEKLYGLSGTLRFCEAESGDGLYNGIEISFATDLTETTNTSGAIEPDSLSLLQLMFLSQGLLHLGENKYLHISEFEEGNNSDSDDEEDWDRSRRVRIRNNISSEPTPPWAYSHDPQHSGYSIGESSPGNRTTNRNRYRTVTSRPTVRRPQKAVHVEALPIRLWGLVERTFGEGLVTCIDVDFEKVKCFFLAKIRMESRIYSELENTSGSTYVPANMSFIRLGYTKEENYLRRKDAQEIAYALLQMAWHSSGYLIPGIERKSLVIDMLCRGSERAIFLLRRISDGMQHLGLSGDERTKFSRAAEPLLKKPTPSMLALYRLDSTIQELQQGLPQIHSMVEILVLTNEEFSDLVYQSARYIETSSKSQIEFDLRAGSVMVPSAFGALQIFQVDMEIMSTGTNATSSNSRDTVTVKHDVVLLAALRAFVRSSLLNLCPDADAVNALLEGKEETVFHVV